MTIDEKERSDEICAKIDKFNKVVSLCDFDTFSSYSIDSINEVFNSASTDDKLYILWNWGISDNFSKDQKWATIVHTYSKECTMLIEVMQNNRDYIKQYIREQCQNIQDISLELMYLHKDYNNEDLKVTIDTTIKVINK